ncbi:hypothetical protein DFP72DRAFT_1092218 [Ephemerocybe angulata]|uniref:Fungal-type protein kinase domain-containing protein n=1 Tax=Ephemerocybe angulata TaxID=980116 RepID=A0A8H6IAK6_9AGAR|nr:hypothetical protein DFP72DRAFT_1092213 [Tulosesus angulatus]KAF6760870.1 hypothetical protein DFP72DRAFT_1092218 [Tulosesus angulatus]
MEGLRGVSTFSEVYRVFLPPEQQFTPAPNMPASISKTTVSRVQTRSQTRAEAQPTFDPKNSLRKRDVKTAVKPATRSKEAHTTVRTTKNVRTRASRASKGVARLAVAQKLTPQAKPNDAREETPASTPEISSCSSPGNNPVSGDDETPYEEAYLAEQRRAAISDLHDIVTVDGSCLKDFYKAAASDRRIKNFLTASALYDYGTNTWTGISREVRDEKTLRASLVKVIKTIVAGLGNVKGSREVVDTHHTAFPHCEDTSQTSKPSISIRATGPSFSEPWVPQGANRVPNAVGFSNVATVFEVKRDADATEAAVDQLAVYNRWAIFAFKLSNLEADFLFRQIFFHQLNRLFCRSLLLTETQVRLLHCDRSGAYKTTAVNIHDDPCIFVRLVLGLSSPHETVLGLDSTVQWTVKDGMKVAGTITTVNDSGKRIKYQLRMDEPHAVRRTVRSRGTVCWNAMDKNGKRILLKDAWRLDDQVPEYTFLERAKGVAGVAQMLARGADVHDLCCIFDLRRNVKFDRCAYPRPPSLCPGERRNPPRVRRSPRPVLVHYVDYEYMGFYCYQVDGRGREADVKRGVWRMRREGDVTGVGGLALLDEVNDRPCRNNDLRLTQSMSLRRRRHIQRGRSGDFVSRYSSRLRGIERFGCPTQVLHTKSVYRREAYAPSKCGNDRRGREASSQLNDLLVTKVGESEGGSLTRESEQARCITAEWSTWKVVV